MQVFIRYNTTLTFEFNPTDTIANVKDIYYQRTGIQSNHIILSHNGKYLYDLDPISKYNITDNSTIHMNIKMPL